MTLDELLEYNGFDLKQNTKLLRNASKKIDVNKIYKMGLIQEYQSIEENDIFHWKKNENNRDSKDKCRYIISFLGNTPGTTATFIGVYEIIGIEKINNIPDNISCEEIRKEYEEHIGCYFYTLRKIDILNQYEGKLVVDWGNGTRAWHQWLGRSKSQPKQIISK